MISCILFFIRRRVYLFHVLSYAYFTSILSLLSLSFFLFFLFQVTILICFLIKNVSRMTYNFLLRQTNKTKKEFFVKDQFIALQITPFPSPLSTILEKKAREGIWKYFQNFFLLRISLIKFCGASLRKFLRKKQQMGLFGML